MRDPEIGVRKQRVYQIYGNVGTFRTPERGHRRLKSIQSHSSSSFLRRKEGGERKGIIMVIIR